MALLRKRVDVPAADPAKENLFDANVEEAVRPLSAGARLSADGMVGPGARRVLNQQKPAADLKSGPHTTDPYQHEALALAAE